MKSGAKGVSRLDKKRFLFGFLVFIFGAFLSVVEISKLSGMKNSCSACISNVNLS